jgi:hypothetical protein
MMRTLRFTMKRHFWSLLATCALTAGFAVAQTPQSPANPDSSDVSDAPKKKEKVTKLDGTSILGIVTLTDDYTLKISNDSGIFNVPLALLGEKDFKKFTSGKDRSQDGKLWSERQDALENQKEENSKEGGSQKKGATDNSAIEIQLSEIAVFQPVISVYESTLGGVGKTAKSSDSQKTEGEDGAEKNSTEDAKPVRLFSGPGGGGIPYNGIGSGLVEPVMSVGGSVLQSAGGVVPSAPVGVPGAP